VIAEEIKSKFGVSPLIIEPIAIKPSYFFISSAITNGLIQLSILYKKPIGNAILTCISEAQAKKRGDKGYEAALAVLEVLNAK
jgi:6,7-dimethyl-8-ribityllumazine synthase